jgi:hypothetical protein
MPVNNGSGLSTVHAMGVPYHMCNRVESKVSATISYPNTNSIQEVQLARCMSARYKADGFSRCVSCTRRWAGDTCRFQNIRVLMRDIANKTLVGTTFQPLEWKMEGPSLIYPDKWNIMLERQHIDRVMVCP